MAGSIKLYGPSGYTEIAADVDADDNVLTLPSVAGSLLTSEGGKILQIVRSTDTTDRSTTSTSNVDVTGMSVTITPQKNDSVVLLVMTARVYGDRGSAGDKRINIILTDNSNNGISGAQNHIIGGQNDGANINFHIVTLIAYATPSTTNAVTYKTRFSVQNGSTTAVFQNSTSTGQMFAIEVSA
jgi:hypothetical protein